MAEIVINIPTPTLPTGVFFIGVLYDANGNVLAAYNDITNAPYTIDDLDDGTEYKICINYPENESVCECFTTQVTPPCDCPTNVTASYSLINGVSYITFQFDTDDVSSDCSLVFNVIGYTASQPPGSSYQTTVTVTDINSLIHITGNTYQKKFQVPALASYDVFLGQNVIAKKISRKCFSDHIMGNTTTHKNCIAILGDPTQVFNQTITAQLIRNGSGQIQIQLNVHSQPDPWPYQPISLNYSEQFGCDNGTINSINIPNTIQPFSFVLPQILNPCVPWTNQYGGLYHNAYGIDIYGCTDPTYGALLALTGGEAPAP